MFELADRLVGIYKTENATKSVTINPKALQQQLDRAYNNAAATAQVAAAPLGGGAKRGTARNQAKAVTEAA